MEELAKQLGITTVYATATYAFFHWLDESASDEAKAALARTMSLKDYKSQQVASALVEIFDRIYTYPLLRWRAFMRSLLFTLTVTAIFTFEARNTPGIEGLQRGTIAKTYLVAITINILSDYISLFAIRRWLARPIRESAALGPD
ncbi:hypothetical protein G6321_00019150 [Bradyrhizobium barranii subsp. barranii]|uniref:Uncharacterized protein n=1 Tax=Bradyrhizobium barranii subsp. barranii TaxID=2823807 RepID=A0A7Z0QKB6_9BRAD|nr:hypothetical protein [Bradyrhizobium barranii]UGX97130.1 hypothetical protein G6321_00019150 [Bradyrhizobium barranii subsp. barranii]